eukprot:3157349-Rhodomonas_salina.1
MSPGLHPPVVSPPSPPACTRSSFLSLARSRIWMHCFAEAKQRQRKSLAKAKHRISRGQA